MIKIIMVSNNMQYSFLKFRHCYRNPLLINYNYFIEAKKLLKLENLT